MSITATVSHRHIDLNERDNVMRKSNIHNLNPIRQIREQQSHRHQHQQRSFFSASRNANSAIQSIPNTKAVVIQSFLHLDHAPALLPSLIPIISTSHHTLLSLLELAQTLHLLEYVFEEVLATHDVEVAFDLGVFFGETVDFFLGEAAA